MPPSDQGRRAHRQDRRLRKLFEAIGFSNVETFIASGNVIFDASTKSNRSLEKTIDKANTLRRIISRSR